MKKKRQRKDLVNESLECVVAQQCKKQRKASGGGATEDNGGVVVRKKAMGKPRDEDSRIGKSGSLDKFPNGHIAGKKLQLYL